MAPCDSVEISTSFKELFPEHYVIMLIIIMIDRGVQHCFSSEKLLKNYEITLYQPLVSFNSLKRRLS